MAKKGIVRLIELLMETCKEAISVRESAEPIECYRDAEDSQC